MLAIQVSMVPQDFLVNAVLMDLREDLVCLEPLVPKEQMDSLEKKEIQDFLVCLAWKVAQDYQVALDQKENLDERENLVYHSPDPEATMASPVGTVC